MWKHNPISTSRRREISFIRLKLTFYDYFLLNWLFLLSNPFKSRFWKRFVDDVCSAIKYEHESKNLVGCLDITVHRHCDGHLWSNVFRKQNHTERTLLRRTTFTRNVSFPLIYFSAIHNPLAVSIWPNTLPMQHSFYYTLTEWTAQLTSKRSKNWKKRKVIFFRSHSQMATPNDYSRL